MSWGIEPGTRVSLAWRAGIINAPDTGIVRRVIHYNPVIYAVALETELGYSVEVNYPAHALTVITDDEPDVCHYCGFVRCLCTTSTIMRQQRAELFADLDFASVTISAEQHADLTARVRNDHAYFAACTTIVNIRRRYFFLSDAPDDVIEQYRQAERIRTQFA